MDYKYIEQLLNRYFEASTTLKEEEILKAFFAQDVDDMPVALLPYKSLFATLERRDVLTDDFDHRILSLIGIEEQQADASHADTDEEPDVSKARIISISERLRPLFRAAAVVAVIVTLSTAINESFRDDNVWTDEDQIARYQDEMQKAAIAEATADSLYGTTGYIE